MGLFDKTIQEFIDKAQDIEKNHPELIEKFEQEHPELSNEYTVKCPTCGCTKVRRISSAEKIGNTIAFGFFGNKRKKQFECLNPKCKYRW